MNLQRLDKIISSQMNIPRSEARTAIRRGRVTVGGEICRDAARATDPDCHEICFDGKAVLYKPYIYIVMNKPKGVLCASSDKNRETVVALVPPALRRKDIAPVGRLDKDTTGLLLITDDGGFAHRVISPKSNIKKLYRVTLDGAVPEDLPQKFASGITLADGTDCLPAGLEIIGENEALAEICEGKYHQIKRMFGTADLGVNELCRLKIGNFSLPEDLNEGECREITADELSQIIP